MKKRELTKTLKKVAPVAVATAMTGICVGMTATYLNEQKNLDIISGLNSIISESNKSIEDLEKKQYELRLDNEELMGINSSLTNDINSVISKNQKLAEIAGTKGDVEKALKAEKVLIEISAYYTGEPGVGVITASGERVEIGHIAAPPEIPFGTKVIIEGFHKTYTVTDRGGYIKKIYNDKGQPVYRVDIYVNNHEEAEKIGRKVVEGYFIYE